MFIGGIGIFVIISIILAIIQISIFKALPNSLKNLLAYIPILAILSNFGFSSIILLFTGVGSFCGLSNLAGSVLFGGWVIGYKIFHKLKVEWYWYSVRTGLWEVKLFKYPTCYADNTEEYWLF